MISGMLDLLEILWDVNSGEEDNLWQLVSSSGEKVLLSNVGGAQINNVSEQYRLEKVENIPTGFTLNQNFPNPFNPLTTISFGVPKNSNIALHIFDLSGTRISTILNEEMSPGFHSIQWDGTDENGARIASGIYIYNLTDGSNSIFKKMIYIK